MEGLKKLTTEVQSDAAISYLALDLEKTKI